MGISGLLPVLKDITKKQHVRDFAGKTVAIDGYSWLYKGAYSCAKELCENEPTEKYVAHLHLHTAQKRTFAGRQIMWVELPDQCADAGRTHTAFSRKAPNMHVNLYERVLLAGMCPTACPGSSCSSGTR